MPLLSLTTFPHLVPTLLYLCLPLPIYWYLLSFKLVLYNTNPNKFTQRNILWFRSSIPNYISFLTFFMWLSWWWVFLRRAHRSEQVRQVLPWLFSSFWFHQSKPFCRDFADKGPSSQSHGLSNSHVWMWELDYKESWAQKNWCFWTVVLEKSPSDYKEIKPVNPKGN